MKSLRQLKTAERGRVGLSWGLVPWLSNTEWSALEIYIYLYEGKTETLSSLYLYVDLFICICNNNGRRKRIYEFRLDVWAIGWWRGRDKPCKHILVGFEKEGFMWCHWSYQVDTLHFLGALTSYVTCLIYMAGSGSKLTSVWLYNLYLKVLLRTKCCFRL